MTTRALSSRGGMTLLRQIAGTSPVVQVFGGPAMEPEFEHIPSSFRMLNVAIYTHLGGGALGYVTEATEKRIAELGSRVALLEEEKASLELRVAALENDVKQLKRGLQEAGEEETAVVIRTIPRDQAKEEIRKLFATGEVLYYSDIVRRLGLDISLVVELCKELEAKGEVFTVGSTT